MTDDRHPDGRALLALLHEEIDGAEASAIEAHCADCTVCGQELAALRGLSDRLAADPPVAGPAPVWPRVSGRLARRETRRLTPSFAVAVTAACAAGIVLGVLLGSGGVPSTAESTSWQSSVDRLWGEREPGSLLDVYSADMNSKTSEES